MSIARRRLVVAAAGLLLPTMTRALDGVATPLQPEGPFFPDPLPLELDADLLRVGDGSAALGTPVELAGSVRDPDGRPLAGALIEIWQVDAQGIYLHPAEGPRLARRDAGFQGYGRSVTDAQGRYRFRTLRPVPYPGRAPHIHVRVWHRREHLLTTQLYVEGEPLNRQDFLLKRIVDPRQRANVIVPFTPDPRAAGRQLARFDIVLGRIPQQY